MNSPSPILIVDDEAVNRQLLSRYLQRKGYAVAGACCGEEALEYVASRPVDLVLLDTRMPRLSGLDVLRKIRESHPPNRLPVVMVTANQESRDIVEALTLGANDYLTKPVDLPVALARIQVQLSLKHTEEALLISQKRYEVLFHSIEGMVWEAPFGRPLYSFVSMAAKRLFGYDLECWTTRPFFWKSIIHPDDLARVDSNSAAECAAGGPRHMDYRMITGDGRIIWIRDTITVARDDGAPAHLRGMMVDISELRNAEEELRRSHADLEKRVAERTASLAASNAALERQIAERRSAEQARQRLLQRLVAAQEDERRRVSIELHDQIGQHLAALNLGLRALDEDVSAGKSIRKRIVQLQELSGTVMKDMHHLAWELRPPLLDDWGLQTALRRYLEMWQERSGIMVDFQAAGIDDGRLPTEVETTIYRIIQEALTNVLKHARARHVSVLLQHSAKRMVVIVEDDGAGFDTRAIFESADSQLRLGLLGMQERAAAIGASLDIESEIGGGTTVFLKHPTHADTGAAASRAAEFVECGE